MGLGVLVAGDGREAVEIFRARADEISAVLLDVTMPEMGGAEGARAIRSIRPATPLLVVSGRGDAFAREQVGEGASTHFLPKPFSQEDLAKALEPLLDPRPEAAGSD